MTETLVSPEQRSITSLQVAIRAFLQDKALNWIEKEDEITGRIKRTLHAIGKFYRTEAGTALFFRNSNFRLYEISSRPESDFGRLMTGLRFKAGSNKDRGLL